MVGNIYNTVEETPRYDVGNGVVVLSNQKGEFITYLRCNQVCLLKGRKEFDSGISQRVKERNLLEGVIVNNGSFALVGLK